MSDALVVIVGPTASGKTELAIRLAEKLGGEIVSADSVQVYRHFEIGSGKPSIEEKKRAPHHLIDVIEPDQPIDAARWAELADSAIAEIRSRSKTPIVCGGTFLWVKALLFGLAEAPAGDPEVRARHSARVEREGRPALHAELARVDPAAAARLSPNDFVRVSRALEVFELSGVPLSDWQARHAFRTPRHHAQLIGVDRSRDELDTRIRARATRMFEVGLIDEVRTLLAAGYASTRPMGAVGYKQVHAAIACGSPIDPQALLEEVVRATRIFARRQRTWLRDQPVVWLPPEISADQAIERVRPAI